MELWAKEYHSQDMAISYRIKQTLHTERSPYQEIALVDTYQYGRMLLLDNVVQTTEQDEFVYHEMITHVPLNAHPNPTRVLVVGGGDGGAVREILRHPTVESVVLVEIDQRVVDLAREYLPTIACGLDDPRVMIKIADGIEYVKQAKNEFDLIIVDSTDPIGPAVGLFAQEFYRDLHRALRPDGMFVAQTESPWVNRELIPGLHEGLRQVFPIVRLYLAAIPTYQSGLFSFTVCSKEHDPTVSRVDAPVVWGKYYSQAVHQAAFVLPPFITNLIKMR